MNALLRLLSVWFYRFLRLFGVRTPLKVFLYTKKKETKLYLSGKNLTNQDLVSIATYTHWEFLYLGNNQISDITSLQKLTNLKELWLDGNQITDITTLQYLTKLSRLWLNNNQITDITPLQRLVNLKILWLNNNQVADITPLQNLINIKVLELGKNKIVDVPYLQNLAKLQYLDFANNQITYISLSFLNAFPCIEILRLEGNLIRNLPKEVFDKRTNVLHEVRAYLESIQDVKDRRELNEAKLLIVGVGDVGKTEIVEALSTENYEFNPTRQTTKGVRIKQWKPPHCTRAGKQVDFTAHIWDFAGQEINYGTHQFFLTKNSVYVFVWETRKGEKESKFDYWLQIVSLLSAQAPVLVVQNKVDIYEDEINQRDWKGKFPHIVDFYKTSCQSGKGIAELRKAITEQLIALPNTTEIWNKDWYAVRTELEQNQEDYITLKEYNALCVRYDLPTHHADSLSKQLHDIGIILHFADDMHLSDTVVLKTDWATEAAYCLLDNKTVLQGRFRVEQLQSIWKEVRFAGKFPFLLRLMERFELVFKLQDKEEYIVPEGLPIDNPNLNHKVGTMGRLNFEYHYEFMPKGILSRFICRMHRYIVEELFWRFGVVLAYNQAQALVRLNDVEEILSISVWGYNADILLQIIRHQIQDIHTTLKNPPLKEKVPCVCAVCKKSEKPYLHNYQTLVSFKEKNRDTRECERSAEDVPIDSLLKGITHLKDSPASRLAQLLFRYDLVTFFKEVKRLGLVNPALKKLEKEFIGGKTDEEFIERLQVWLQSVL